MIAKLRSSTFIKIRIESGRYRGIPKSQRTCQRCNSGSVDDEIHLMLHCQKFSIERINLLSKANEIQENFQSLDDISKLEVLLSNPAIVNMTAKYVLQCNL